LQSLFGVFDGHGGAKAVEFAVENLDKNIIDEVMRKLRRPSSKVTSIHTLPVKSL
jgi:serine/threonine protein phosphatase PrpC